MNTPATALAIDDLHFTYGRNHFEIAIAALRLEPGEQVLLTGGSGTGKSTILQIIAGLVDPRRGTVRVAGKEMHALHGAARDRFRGAHIGMIFQTFNLLQGFSALENVLAALMFGELPRHEHRGHALGLLKSLGIAKPDALVETMSVGQQQRVAVARAVACRPALVLADEPTASLDPENSAAAIELIQRTCSESGAALLCTSHDPAMKARFPRVESLDDLRRPIATGTGAGA
ncbi:MAG: ATP-binding cassette domain-containing protein [Phycisphaeraceae bacterium]|nr:ATP-binding cassette domain-containing protein [Phycisphaeraceae bacterium]